MEFVQPIRDEKQLKAIKHILKANNLRDYVLFVLGINSGLRISDILNLRVKDVLDDKGKIKERISIREKRTGKLKDYTVGQTTAKALREYIDDHLSPGDPLFQSRKGSSPITKQQAYRIINDAARMIGIKERIGTHTLRKTYGYMALKRGVDVRRLQQLFNHSAPSVTLTYIGITQDELDNIYLDLNL